MTVAELQDRLKELLKEDGTKLDKNSNVRVVLDDAASRTVDVIDVRERPDGAEQADYGFVALRLDMGAPQP